MHSLQQPKPQAVTESACLAICLEFLEVITTNPCHILMCLGVDLFVDLINLSMLKIMLGVELESTSMPTVKQWSWLIVVERDLAGANTLNDSSPCDRQPLLP